jgi:DNA recombination protein RmuC
MSVFFPPEFIALAVVLVLAIAASAWWVRASLLRQLAKPPDPQPLLMLQSDVQNQMNAVKAELIGTRQAMDSRLDNAARVIHDVHGRLGELRTSTEHLAEIGKDIAGLQSILKAPKLRGGIGELFLEDLLRQILAWDRFRTQYEFRGGEKVDAVILLQDGMVPVDAKFPLENFQRILRATTDEERKATRRAFIRDVKTHVDAIASKYIRPDEGTFDFALMYIPAENVYYETIIKDDEFGGEMALFQHALNRRVIPVSPNSMYAYLNTILLGLKGLRVEESAREIMDGIARVNSEFDRFVEAFRLVGRHLENSAKQFQEADKRLGKVEGKMQEIDGVVKGLDKVERPALDAPTEIGTSNTER